MRVLVTRPREDGEEIAARLGALGHEAIVAPLLEVKFHDDPPPLLEDVQAILATSANGIKALARRTSRRDLPVFAVGPQTASAARSAGFGEIKNADGDARALAEATMHWASPGGGALLHVTGEQSAGTLAAALAAAGFTLRKAVLYDVIAAEALPPIAAKALGEGKIDAALFFSPRSARIFRDCVTREQLAAACTGLLAICISAATAERLAPLAFAGLRIAASPNQEALLARLEH